MITTTPPKANTDASLQLEACEPPRRVVVVVVFSWNPSARTVETPTAVCETSSDDAHLRLFSHGVHDLLGQRRARAVVAAGPVVPRRLVSPARRYHRARPEQSPELSSPDPVQHPRIGVRQHRPRDEPAAFARAEERLRRSPARWPRENARGHRAEMSVGRSTIVRPRSLHGLVRSGGVGRRTARAGVVVVEQQLGVKGRKPGEVQAVFRAQGLEEARADAASGAPNVNADDLPHRVSRAAAGPRVRREGARWDSQPRLVPLSVVVLVEASVSLLFFKSHCRGKIHPRIRAPDPESIAV